MKAVAAYIASKSLQRGGDDRRNDYGGHENRQYSGNQRQPNQYGARNGMDEHWPRSPGMERGGDSGSRMTYDDGEPESRYRGRDGRWKAGRRRSEMSGGMDEGQRRCAEQNRHVLCVLCEKVSCSVFYNIEQQTRQMAGLL